MDSNQLRTGMKVMYNGEPHEVLESQLRQQPRAVAKMVTKMKNLLSGGIIEKTFTSGENIDKADIETKKSQFLYVSGDMYSFMDDESFEQFDFEEDVLGDKIKYLVEGMEVFIMFWGDKPLSIQLPPTVVLEVTHTEPGVKGDTATGGTKPATLQTGLVTRIPLFVDIGEKVVVSTETGEYRERAK